MTLGAHNLNYLFGNTLMHPLFKFVRTYIRVRSFKNVYTRFENMDAIFSLVDNYIVDNL